MSDFKEYILFIYNKYSHDPCILQVFQKEIEKIETRLLLISKIESKIQFHSTKCFNSDKCLPFWYNNISRCFFKYDGFDLKMVRTDDIFITVSQYLRKQSERMTPHQKLNIQRKVLNKIKIERNFGIRQKHIPLSVISIQQIILWLSSAVGSHNMAEQLLISLALVLHNKEKTKILFEGSGATRLTQTFRAWLAPFISSKLRNRLVTKYANKQAIIGFHVKKPRKPMFKNFKFLFIAGLSHWGEKILSKPHPQLTMVCENSNKSKFLKAVLQTYFQKKSIRNPSADNIIIWMCDLFVHVPMIFFKNTWCKRFIKKILNIPT